MYGSLPILVTVGQNDCQFTLELWEGLPKSYTLRNSNKTRSDGDVGVRIVNL
jgi:hypothetical protein